MISFKDDYSEGAHPAILEALIKSNLEQQGGYGQDQYTQEAVRRIQEMTMTQSDVHLISGGTQTNMLAISSFLRPHEAVVAAATGHIAVHETGAIEATGHKVLTVETRDGKLTPEHIEPVLNEHINEHMVKPGMVYISNPTELGTYYDVKELQAIYDYCQQKELLLYVDGARLGTVMAIENSGITLATMAKYSDAFFIGGTKNGALLGEALVIVNDGLKADFRYMIKQKGALMAKGRVLGLQFKVLFEDDLYINLAKHANAMASKLRDGLKSLGISFMLETKTNQLFPIFSKQDLEALAQKFDFIMWQELEDQRSIVRFVTSWATSNENVEAILKALQ